jgi:sugar O-acyltransferase (sialic acid O-acetyltransferase NeuD family)
VRDLVVVGGGGHGRELLDAVAALNQQTAEWKVLGVVDDDPGKNVARLERLGVPLLGPVTWLEEHPGAYALGIGTSGTRRALATRLDASGCEAVTVVHPEASVGAASTVGTGSVVYQRSVITTNVTIGAHTHLNVACAVQHDTTVGDFVQFSPGVLVNGDCVIGDDVFLGTGAIITRGCTVGDGARIGAGAVVLADVAAGVTAVGIPARS